MPLSHFKAPVRASALFVLLCSSTAIATVGDSRTITGTWWDPDTREIVVHLDAAEQTIERRKLGLDASRPRRFSTAGYGAPGEELEVPERYIPLREEDPGRVSARVVRAVRHHSSDEELHDSYELRVQLSGPRGRREIRLRAFRSADVRVVAVRSVPGEPAAVVLLEYMGLGFESGYTVEEPVLIRWAR